MGAIVAYGLGDSQVVIGPDGQPRVVTTSPINVDTVLPSGTNVIQDASGNVQYVSSAPGVGGMSTGTLIAIGGGVLGLVLLVKAVSR